MTRPLQSVLYQSNVDPTTYYLDEGLTVKVQIHILGLEGTALAEQEDEEMLEASTTEAIPRNECFNKDQTLFLIDLMRQKLVEDGGELPKTLKELNSKVKMGKGSKKLMWKDMAGKLSELFKVSFDPDKVARKWGTLEEAYKKIKDNNRTTGKGTMRFQFYNEMEELLGGHHDIEYPVVGTAEGLEIRRPDLLTENRQTLVPVSHPHPPIPPTNTSSARRRRSDESPVKVRCPKHPGIVYPSRWPYKNIQKSSPLIDDAL
ncbi:hypothetical protein N1851_010704 [Merluccius polli]|uniref:Myb/SANT-like DNA-binding domain-containing protein n=1 Tax=Merluccius polli TaxID=89951 RepID=A0AA47P5B9_MERPO|nr:hypothetical protein N1851_010704 [Merluccius polli]